MSPDIAARLGDTIREVLGEPDLVVTDDLTAAQVEGWDSVAHVELMFTIEETFGISFPVEEILDHPDVGTLRRDIERYLGRG